MAHERLLVLADDCPQLPTHSATVDEVFQHVLHNIRRSLNSSHARLGLGSVGQQIFVGAIYSDNITWHSYENPTPFCGGTSQTSAQAASTCLLQY